MAPQTRMRGIGSSTWETRPIAAIERSAWTQVMKDVFNGEIVKETTYHNTATIPTVGEEWTFYYEVGT